ncbi:MAG: hypothetical protein Q7T73_15365, partial [Beijerinckiaceae bacterium]|nr:hypothetical protein [Beijerinckiaceae bacterium]
MTARKTAQAGIVAAVVRAPTLADAKRVVAGFTSKDRRDALAIAWAHAFVALRPGDGELIG